MGSDTAQTRSERVLKHSNEPPLSEGHTSGSGEGSMEHTFEMMDTIPPTPHNSPLTGGYTPRSDEGRLKLKELMAMCTKLSKQVLDLEKENDAQAIEILKLMQRVKKLERKRKSSISHPRRRIYRQVESSDDDLDKEDASKQRRTSYKTKLMFKDSDFDDLNDLVDEGMAFVQEKDVENQGKIGVDDTEAVNTAGERVSTAAPRTPPTTITVFDDEDVTMAMAQTLIKMKEEKVKEKGVVIKDVEDFSRPIRSITTLQPLPTIDPKDKDAEVALRLQAELDKELKVERERQEEASMVSIADMFDEVHARIYFDYELAARMTQEEQEKYIIKKGPGSYATQKSPKKPKVTKSAKVVTEEEAAEYEKEKEDLRLSLKIISNDDSEVNYKPLSRKFPIVNWEYQLLGKIEEKDMYVYKLTRADGSLSYHGDTQAFLRRADRQDLNDLYRMIFDPDEKDELWMNQLDCKLLRWKLYESCGVHNLFMDGKPMEINMLVEKKYPLIKELLEKMLNL
ncbi:hypothetical protein Tco_0812817 [Tanacetum coccineum]